MTMPMSGTTPSTTSETSGSYGRTVPGRTRYTGVETKPAYKTTELGFFILAVIGVLIATAVVKGFTAAQGWFYVTLLTMGYLLSRGLAKMGSCHHDSGDSTIDLR